MEKIQNLWKEIIEEESVISALFSNVRNKNEIQYKQVRIKPILIKNQKYYHLEYIFDSKVTHENLQGEQFIQRVMELSGLLKQINIYTSHTDYQILISKKLKVTLLEKQASKVQDMTALSHNKEKQYIFEIGKPIPFLVELGIMNSEGMVNKNKYNKFRQINRFIEMIKDIVSQLPMDKQLRIIDFGCGKSYLTFALHYYLQELCGLNVEIIGLDLKEDVINTCNRLVKKLDLTHLHFVTGSIEDFKQYNEVDMVITLHACNTATDAAIAKAIQWNAKVILSAPCCHHEFYTQMASDTLAPILNYGIIKERFAALATDGIQGQILEMFGYKTQLLEFIDMEHTPKNILIRAVKTKSTRNMRELISNYKELISFLSVNPSLATMLEKELNEIITSYVDDSEGNNHCGKI